MAADSDLLKDTLVIANPGTGKTTSLAKKAADILSNGGKESDILCITFTQKAAAEMRKRINDEISGKGLNVNPDLIEVHTFHSYAFNYLNGMGLEFEIASNNLLRYSILTSFLEDEAFNYQRDYLTDEFVPKCENAIRYLKSYGILPDDIDTEKVGIEIEREYDRNPPERFSIEEERKFLDYFIRAYRRYEEEKNSAVNLIDYNDMLIKFVKSHNGRKRYRYVLVDELQDVNELEAEIAKLSGEKLFLVGDKKQAIFGFQGGSLNTFKNFQDDTKYEKVILGENYRSLQPILDYAKWHFYKNFNDESYKEELENLKSVRKEGSAVVKVIGVTSQRPSSKTKKLDLVSAAVETYFNVKRGDGEKIAIIARTNNQLSSISKLLDSKNVKYSTTSDSYASKEARKEIIAYLRGLLNDNRDSIVNALFTPFSGVTLKEAFEISKQWDIKNEKDGGAPVPDSVENLAKSFFSRKRAMTMEGLRDVFRDIVIPISFQIGKDYYITAQTLNEGMVEFFDTVKKKTKESFLDYLSVLDQEYESPEEDGGLILTTVHKAKGREFDTVIYVPSESRANLSYLDIAVKSIIKTAKGIDVDEELKRENVRVDFVAFTRAKDRLFIITNNLGYKNENVEFEEVSSYGEMEPQTTSYDEAYQLFVNGRYEDAKKFLHRKEKWLIPRIREHFSGLLEISYTGVEIASRDVYEYLKEKILKVSEPRREALLTGLNAHRIAESLFKGTLNEESLSERERDYLENIRRVNEELISATNSRQVGAEVKLEAKLNELFNDLKENLIFKGVIDALFESNENGLKKYVILDYKTDKTEEYSSEHRRQLAVYKKLLASKSGTDERNISIAIGYIGLRGKVNTGKNDYKLDLAQEKKGQVETFAKHLNTFLDYRRDTMNFVNELMSKEVNEPLYGNIVDQLKLELQEE
ncbi:MAG: UvrD-helicase domain-containing protein [Thermoplasmata archaeon]